MINQLLTVAAMVSEGILGGSRPSLSVGGLDAARTNRLNEAHWADAKDVPINATISSDLAKVRARCNHEFMNNAVLKGMLKTYRDDFVGPDGPKLTVRGGPNSKWNETLEQIWREWWAKPDLNGVHSGADLLGLAINTTATAGDYLWQIVTDRDARTPIKTRILSHHPRRLATPFDRISDENVFMGIRLTPTGRPLGYYLQKAEKPNQLTNFSTQFQFVPAKDMIHGFEVLEPGQFRGLPWFHWALPSTADARDFEQQVMDAARSAASLSVYFFTRNAEAEFQQVEEITDIERGTQSFLPPGYEPGQVNPQQPSNTFSEFMDHQARKMGRPKCIPLSTVNLDHRGLSWSSARLERDVFHQGIRVERGGQNRGSLSRLLNIIATESILAGELEPLPLGMRILERWTWSEFASVNPREDATAGKTRKEAGQTTLERECARQGLDWMEVLEQLAREKEKMEELGLVPSESKPPPKNGKPSSNGNGNGRMSELAGVGT
ncbi:MAG: phage portal protein [Phycisphaerales bacterium]|nr:phage portal protein [Phycisphaerales bacterium]